jgi:hypothetical protein
VTNKSKPYNMRVIDAVGASELPADLRHLLMVMAYLANSATGRGLSSQVTIGRFIGCNDRSVRQKLERLEALPDAPVRVVRHYRQRRDGRGRTSDEYQLVILTNRHPAAGDTTGPTGNELPVEQPDSCDDQPATECGPTGNPMHDQPATGCQGSTEGSTEKDPRRSLSRSKRATRGSASASKKGERAKAKKPKAERTPEQLAAYRRTLDCYFEEFAKARGAKPVFGKIEGKNLWTLLEKFNFDDSKACAAIVTAYQSFRAKSVTILNIASNPQGFEVQPAKARNGRPPAVQPGDDYDLTRYEAKNAEA